MALEEALQEQEEKVEVLIKASAKYVGALKNWKKACQIGHISNLQKFATQAVDLGSTLPGATEEVGNAWEFDVRAYLVSEEWRTELQSVALSQFNLKTLLEGESESIVSSPVTVRSAPARSILTLGKVVWPSIRPKVVAAELKRLRDKSANANSSDFLESLYKATVYLSSEKDPNTTFQKIYSLFCLTPGYKKENPAAAFGQQIYALGKSDLRATKAGKKINFEGATGNVAEKDVFSVQSEDGRTIRFHTLYFK